MTDETEYQRRELFRDGRLVNLALPRGVALKPNDKDMAHAAKTTGFSKAHSWRSWVYYTWFSAERE